MGGADLRKGYHVIFLTYTSKFEEGRFLFRFPIESREKKVSLQRFRHQPLPKQKESAKVHI